MGERGGRGLPYIDGVAVEQSYGLEYRKERERERDEEQMMRTCIE